MLKKLSTLSPPVHVHFKYMFLRVSFIFNKASGRNGDWPSIGVAGRARVGWLLVPAEL